MEKHCYTIAYVVDEEGDTLHFCFPFAYETLEEAETVGISELIKAQICEKPGKGLNDTWVVVERGGDDFLIKWMKFDDGHLKYSGRMTATVFHHSVRTADVAGVESARAFLQDIFIPEES